MLWSKFILLFYRLCSLGSQCTVASFNSVSRNCTYLPHFSLKTLNPIELFVPSSSGFDTYVMDCESVLDTNLLINNDPFTQSSDGWNITNTCSSGGSIGRADHRYSPGNYKSHVAGYQYSWMAEGGKK